MEAKMKVCVNWTSSNLDIYIPSWVYRQKWTVMVLGMSSFWFSLNKCHIVWLNEMNKVLVIYWIIMHATQLPSLLLWVQESMVSPVDHSEPLPGRKKDRIWTFVLIALILITLILISCFLYTATFGHINGFAKSNTLI